MKQVLENKLFSPGMRQGLILMVTVTFAFGIDYLFNLAAGRLLSPAEFSIIVALAGVAQILVVGSRVIQTVVTRFVSRFQALPDAAERTDSFFQSMFRAAWKWGTAAMIVAIILSFPLAKFLQIERPGPVLALAITTLLMVVRPVVGGVLQGTQKFITLGNVQVIQAVVRLAIGVALIMLGWGAFGAMLALPLASALALVYGWWILTRSRPSKSDIHHEVTLSDLTRYSGYAALGLIGFALLINMDAILVRRFFNPAEAGNYSAAITLGKIIQFFPIAIIMLLFPKAALHHASRRDPARLLIPAMLIVILICGGIAMLYALFGETIIRLTLGPDYELDPRVLGLVGLAMLLLSLANVWLNYFLSIEQPRYVYLIGFGIFVQAALMLRFHEELWQLPAAMAVTGFWLTLIGAGIFWSGRRQKIPQEAL